MDTNLEIGYFISFCIEQYKSEKGISGGEAIAFISLILRFKSRCEVNHLWF